MGRQAGSRPQDRGSANPRQGDGLARPRQAAQRSGLLTDDPSRLAWIFGSSRSGSTWLLRMLSELDGMAGIDDPHIGHHLGVWRPISLAWAASEELPELKRLKDVKAEKPSYFFNERYRDVWRPALRELIATRFEAEAGDVRPGFDRVVVKEPGSQCARLLLDLFPGSKLIFLLRDGRDVVDSWVDAYRRGSWALEEGAFPASVRGRVDLVRWQSSVWAHRTEEVRQAYLELPPGDRVLVRYENLLTNTAGELARICEALEIDHEGEEFAEIARAHRFSRVPGRGSGRAERSATPGAWRRNLSVAEQDAMAQLMGPLLVELGYVREDDLRPRASLARVS
jgi:hypothetical protein